MISTPIPSSEQTPAQKVVNFLDKKGKLELWAGTIAAKGIAFGQRQQELNQAAEDAFVRKKLWGDQSQKSSDEMGGHTILGDIIVPQQPQPAPVQSSGIGKILAGAALGASLLGIPGAGIAGYLLNRTQTAPPVQQAPPQDGETINLGLLKLEDLKKGTE